MKARRVRILTRRPAKVLAFYEANPDEELTFADLQLKFGGSLNAVRMTVYRLAMEGRLEIVRLVRVPSGSTR